MSNKALRRALEERKKEDDEIHEVIVEPEFQTKQHNVFDLLNEEEIGDTNDTNEENEEIDLSVFDVKPKKKKKKNKKKKKKTKKDDFDFDLNGEQKQEEIEEKTELKNPYSILGVTLENLNPDNEYRRLFGKNLFTQQKPKHPQQKRKKLWKQTKLVTPKEHWPPFHNPGIELVLVETTKENEEIYKFEYSQNYQKLQQQYHICVESHDPNNFMILLHEHPYHIATLLSMAEVFKLQGEADRAQELVEQALYCIECQFTQKFYSALKEGRARLPFKYEENQYVYQTLATRVHQLGKVGCYTTAVELSKMLYSFDIENDPFYVLLFIDHYANRAHMHDFLFEFINFVSSIKGEHFSYLPNFMLNKAIAQFKLNLFEEAALSLQETLKIWPMIVAGIVAKAKLEVKEWEPLLRNTIFTDVVCTSRAFNSIIHVTVERNTEFFEKELLIWFHENVKQVIEDLKDSKDIDKYDEIRRSLYELEDFNAYANASAAVIFGDVMPIMMGEEGNEGNQFNQCQVM